MYLSHYNLKEKPFQISTDPKFMWLGESHKEALAVLEYGVIDNKGFLLITGDVGTGKTTLINALLKRLGNGTIVANITNPILEKLDFFNFVALEFNINKEFSDKGSFLIYFSRFLNNCYLKNKKVLLIIDEAHKLDQELLEQIRLLSNIERPDTKLLNLFFVGQNEFIDIITDTKNRALRQRITLNYHVDPLKETEVGEYVIHRLKVAGSKGNIFSESAIGGIFTFSKGYPRLINVICDHALLTGYVKDVKTIDEKIIRECANGILLHGERNDYDNHYPKTIKKTTLEKVNAPTVESSGRTENPVLSSKKVNDDNKDPETTQVKAHDSEEKPFIKYPKRKIASIAASVLLLITFGFLYYPGNLAGHIENIKKYLLVGSNEKAELTNIPQIKIAKQKTNASVQDPGKSHYTPLPSTESTAEAYDAYRQEEEIETHRQEEDIINPTKADTMDALASAGDMSQEEHSDKMNQPQQTQTLESITTQRDILKFEHDSNDLSDESFETLEQLTQLIAEHPSSDIFINGYTDSHGNYRYNEKLSKFRADRIKSYFVNQGISPSRIKTFGMGQKDPIASNKTLEGRRLNRRAEVKIVFN